MWIYLIIFALVLTAYFSTLSRGGLSKKTFGFFMLTLCVFVGLGDMLGGYDRYIYGELFDDLANVDWTKKRLQDTAIFLLYFKEVGFVMWNWIMSMITANRYIFIFITTGVMYYLYYKGMVNIVKDLGLALILFLALFFFFTFTYLRQGLAVGIIWYSYRYIVERKLLRFSLLVILATSIHNSAILFFVMYFLCGKRPSKGQIIAGASLILGLGLTGVPSFFFETYISMFQVEDSLGRYLNQSYGMRYEYIIEVLVFLIYLLGNYNKYKDDRITILCFNTAIAFCAILLLFAKSLNGGRLSWPYMLGLIGILSQSVPKKISAYYSSLIIISIALYVRILFFWGILLYPYKTFLTSGVRDGDYIHSKYEYNSNYDNDKFCR